MLMNKTTLAAALLLVMVLSLVSVVMTAATAEVESSPTSEPFFVVFNTWPFTNATNAGKFVCFRFEDVVTVPQISLWFRFRWFEVK